MHQEQVIRDLSGLDHDRLTQVAEYVAFLKFRVRQSWQPSTRPDEWEAACVEASDDDRELAAQGFGEAASALAREDGE